MEEHKNERKEKHKEPICDEQEGDQCEEGGDEAKWVTKYNIVQYIVLYSIVQYRRIKESKSEQKRRYGQQEGRTQGRTQGTYLCRVGR